MKMKHRILLYRAWRSDRLYCDIFVDLPAKVMKDIAPCPKCDSKNINMCDPILNDLFVNYFLKCGDCGHEGPIGEKECCAFSGWGFVA